MRNYGEYTNIRCWERLVVVKIYRMVSWQRASDKPPQVGTVEKGYHQPPTPGPQPLCQLNTIFFLSRSRSVSAPLPTDVLSCSSTPALRDNLGAPSM